GTGKRAALVPAAQFELSVEIIFDAPAIGRQRLELTVDPASFRAEIAPARTFGFIAEVEQLRAMGLGRGASLENTIVVDGDHVMNPHTLRRPGDRSSAATRPPAPATRSTTRLSGRCWPGRRRGE